MPPWHASRADPFGNGTPNVLGALGIVLVVMVGVRAAQTRRRRTLAVAIGVLPGIGRS